MSELSPELFKTAQRYLSPTQDSLLIDVQTVLKSLEHDHISDYSFLVSPISKAYEGYLKDFFLKTGIIDNYNYQSDRFRVGKTLNPSLRYKRFSIYQKLSNLHEEGEKLAEKLWTAWKYGRNEIFHYFPNNLKKLSREEAEERISMLLNAIIDSGRFYDEYLKDDLL